MDGTWVWKCQKEQLVEGELLGWHVLGASRSTSVSSPQDTHVERQRTARKNLTAHTEALQDWEINHCQLPDGTKGHIQNQHVHGQANSRSPRGMRRTRRLTSSPAPSCIIQTTHLRLWMSVRVSECESKWPKSALIQHKITFPCHKVSHWDLLHCRHHTAMLFHPIWPQLWVHWLELTCGKESELGGRTGAEGDKCLFHLCPAVPPWRPTVEQQDTAPWQTLKLCLWWSSWNRCLCGELKKDYSSFLHILITKNTVKSLNKRKKLDRTFKYHP